MNLQQFKDWAISQGSVANPNGSYPSQCVSLIQQYLSKVYNIPFTPRGDAKDWATNGSVLSHLDKVGSPQAGDIGISGATQYNPFGHIWIYTSPSTILEQNGRVTGRVSQGAAYPNPIAILRRKGQQGDSMEIETLRNIAEARRKLLGKVVSAAGVDTGKVEPDNGVDQAVANIDAKNKAIVSLQKQFADATKVANDLQARLVSSENTTKALTEKVDKLNAKVADLDNPDNLVVSRSRFNSIFDAIKGFFNKEK